MALSRHHAAFSRSLSVEEIVHEAQDFDFDTGRSLQQWLRSAKMLLTEASICEQEGNYQNAYLYIYRHCLLVLDQLPKHPDYKDARYKQDVSYAKKAVQRNLAKLEEWKPRINQEHQRYVKAVERRNAERQRVQNGFNQAERERQFDDGARRGSRHSTGSVPPSPTRTVNALEDRDFAVELAHREIRRRDATRTSTRQAGISPATVASRRQGIVGREYGDEGYDRRSSASDGVREVGRHLNRSSHRERGQDARPREAPTSSYQYPSVPRREERMEWRSQPPPSEHSYSRRSLPPAIPAKESLYDYDAPKSTETPPAVPRRPDYDTPTTPAPATRSRSPPPVPSKYTFKPSAFTEGGAPLRTVLLPPDLRTSFLNLAHSNTSRNLETCGILCATPISNALFITHLIIPDQTSTSDTCDTTELGDNALFDYCDSQNLLVCGWIHTHPSQTCFLSSRDLHTSSGYQVMLPEAIAIVCAPRHEPQWGIFRLTDPPGLPHVLECRQSGLFHPHSESNLYTDAVRPGHVVEGPGLEFEVVDLREK